MVAIKGSRHVVPVRLSAWLAGDLGSKVQGAVKDKLPAGCRVTRLPRCLVIEGLQVDQVSIVIQVMQAVEKQVEQAYPVLVQEMGPVFTETVQVTWEVA